MARLRPRLLGVGGGPDWSPMGLGLRATARARVSHPSPPDSLPPKQVSHSQPQSAKVSQSQPESAKKKPKKGLTTSS